MNLEKIYLVFKNHLDIGFTDFASRVEQLYIKKFIPEAIRLARELKEKEGEQKFIWTTGSWLIYNFLEKADIKAKKNLEKAIIENDIAWHALPFSTHSEMLPRFLFEFGLSLSKALDKRFGKKTIAGKMTDVPGHTKSIIPILKKFGIVFLHLGCNPCSTPPKVPKIFKWQFGDSNIIVMYQKGGYGGLIIVPEIKAALYISHLGDNQGPPKVKEVLNLYRELREKFPNAKIIPSTLSDFASYLCQHKEFVDNLEIINYEIGDTWIHGVATDPTKIRYFKELCRLYKKISNHISDKEKRSFLLNLLLVGEHTNGLSTKHYLKEYQSYTKPDFQKKRNSKNFKIMESSWQEQRGYLNKAINSLSSNKLKEKIKQNLKASDPKKPNLENYQQLSSTEKLSLNTNFFYLEFNSRLGSICKLIDKKKKNTWSDVKYELGFARYEIFSHKDYDRFGSKYYYGKCPLEDFEIDFKKPGLEKLSLKHTIWNFKCEKIYINSTDFSNVVVFKLLVPRAAYHHFGAPRDVYYIWEIFNNLPKIQVTFQWHNKDASRIPEAIWFSFRPKIYDPTGWKIVKMSKEINPLEVIDNGNKILHAVEKVIYQGKDGRLEIESLDSLLVACGKPWLLRFENRQPDLRGGIHFNCYNNIWGTNFPLWFDEDAKFRFILNFY